MTSTKLETIAWRPKMESKHTPKDWTVKIVDHEVLVMSGNELIAIVGAEGYPVIDEQAALIAAAPAILSALEAIVDCHGVGSTPAQFVENVANFIDDAKSAIAQARKVGP